MSAGNTASATAITRSAVRISGVRARGWSQARSTRSPEEQLHDAFQRRDAAAARRLRTKHPGFRAMINAPVFAFNSPAIVTMANDAAMVDVLLEFGADPSNILQADVVSSAIGDGRLSLDFGRWSLAE